LINEYVMISGSGMGRTRAGDVQQAAAAGVSGVSGVVGIVELGEVGDLAQFVTALHGARPNATDAPAAGATGVGHAKPSTVTAGVTKAFSFSTRPCRYRRAAFPRKPGI